MGKPPEALPGADAGSLAIPVPLPGRPPGSLARALVGGVRPRQWTKNLLVAAAPFAGGALARPAVLGRTAWMVVAFCLAASGVYLMNDIADRHSDRRHPVKALRPLASGALPLGLAAGGAIAAATAGVVVALLARPAAAVPVVLYLGLNCAYSLRLRRVPVADVTVVTSGFVARVVGGGLAARIAPSPWLLLVVSSTALFVVAGKRHGELVRFGPGWARTRGMAAGYTAATLRRVCLLAFAVGVVAYGLWVFVAAAGDARLVRLSLLPFVLALLRYSVLLEHGLGDAPEELLFHDRPLQLLVLTWLVVYGPGVQMGGGP
jgi:decaprenyl-phosphate phosphoribosyltransferase